MQGKLKIRGDGALDFLALGALVHRLDPGIVPFRKATECAIHVSGGEFNVAANLADCFRLNTGIASAMVDYPIGDLVSERVRAMGVRGFFKRFVHDGATGPNIATVYSDRGSGVRAPVVFYNRSNEAAARLKPGDIDWKKIFGGGVRWFHSGGIFAALSATTPEVIVEGMKAAKAAGAIVSFDLNFREKMLTTEQIAAARARARRRDHARLRGEPRAGLRAQGELRLRGRPHARDRPPAPHRLPRRALVREGTESSGVVQITQDLSRPIEHEDVLSWRTSSTRG
jgi:hypothetical protein